jgi:hypothetical protein
LLDGVAAVSLVLVREACDESRHTHTSQDTRNANTGCEKGPCAASRLQTARTQQERENNHRSNKRRAWRDTLRNREHTEGGCEDGPIWWPNS